MNHFSQIQKALGDFDGVLLTCQHNRLYASGFPSHGTDGMALVTKSAAYYFTDFRYIEAAEQEIDQAAIAMVDRENSYVQRLLEVISRENIQFLGVDEDYMTVSQKVSLSANLPCKLASCSGILSALRQVKMPWEVEQMVTAQRIAERALEEVKNDIKAGVSEQFIAARLEFLMKIYGSEKPAFDTIAVSGVKSSMPHGVPDQKILEDGDFVTMDFGAMCQGYCSDMTRTVAVGHATEEMEFVYKTVLKAQIAGISAVKSGVCGSDVHQVAAEIIDQAGFAGRFGHGFGHGIGVEIHEEPNASPSNRLPLPAGAVISAEPGIYLPGKFGVRIEDMLLVTDQGSENLTKAPKKLEIL